MAVPVPTPQRNDVFPPAANPATERDGPRPSRVPVMPWTVENCFGGAASGKVDPDGNAPTGQTISGDFAFARDADPGGFYGREAERLLERLEDVNT